MVHTPGQMERMMNFFFFVIQCLGIMTVFEQFVLKPPSNLSFSNFYNWKTLGSKDYSGKLYSWWGDKGN